MLSSSRSPALAMLLGLTVVAGVVPLVAAKARGPGAARPAADRRAGVPGIAVGRAALIDGTPAPGPRRHPVAPSAFLPLYRLAAKSFAVDWRLIASVHGQETAFCSAASTYHGLNFAGCCAGPMQFNSPTAR